MARVTLERTPSRIKVDRLLAILGEREHTRKELAAKLSLSEASAYRYLRFLGNENKVYVKRWERTQSPFGGMPTAFYAAGDKPSAPRPKPLSKAEQSRRAYRRMKTDDPAKYCTYLDRAKTRTRMRDRLARGVPVVPDDPLVAAFFGKETRRGT